jgi:hypothetical protein
MQVKQGEKEAEQEGMRMSKVDTQLMNQNLHAPLITLEKKSTQ